LSTRRGTDLLEFRSVTNERRVVERERGQLHGARGRRNIDLGADLLKDRCVVEKDCFAPQIISLEVPDDDCSYLHRLPSWWPSQECAEMRAAPLVLGDDTRSVGAQDATDSHCEVRKAFPMLAIASAVCSGPTNGFGTPTTSLKQSGVMPPSSASISCSLSARMCSRSTAMRFAETSILFLPKGPLFGLSPSCSYRS